MSFLWVRWFLTHKDNTNGANDLYMLDHLYFYLVFRLKHLKLLLVAVL